MIIVKNLEKIYGNRRVFSKICLNFKDRKMYSIVGNSGCGKSTFLNCISSLDNDYSGDVIFDGVNLKALKESERRNYRFNNFGFIFQSFNLFKDETVYNNLDLVINKEIYKSEDDQRNKILDTLKKLKIEALENEYVRNLSGGEKQRVAIGRAILNNPEIIFCDEPTGSLDSKNSEEIFKILKELSENFIIILVSHDETLVKKYSDYIFYIENNRLVENKIVKKSKSNTNKKIHKKVNGSVNLRYIFSSIKNKFKLKKARYFLTNMILSLSLICLGVSIFISDNVSKSINNAFSILVNDKSLVLQKINENMDIVRYGASAEDLVKIQTKYSDYIEYYGASYLNNFHEMFVDQNDFYINKDGFLKQIDFLRFDYFKNFEYFNKSNLEINYENELAVDEIILSLDYNTLENLCLKLEIVRSIESINAYIEEKGLTIVGKFANYSREYEDEQLFKVKKIILKPNIKIYHNNPLYNENLIEAMMRFPSITDIDGTYEMPWLLRKLYYVKTKFFQSDFINSIILDKDYKNFIFESNNYVYSPTECKIGEICYSNKVYVFRILNNLFDYSILDTIKEIDGRFDNYYYSTVGGYYNYGDGIFNGFIKKSYFSCSEKQINTLVDDLSQISTKDFENIFLGSGIASGYVLDNNENNVKFEIYSGEDANNLLSNEVYISSKFASLLNTNNIVGKYLYMSQIYEQSNFNDVINNKFKSIKLKIKGVVNSEKCLIYQKASFSLSLFRDLFEESSFNLIPISVVYNFENKPDKTTINKLNKLFKEYKLVDPFDEINESINSTFRYFNLILLIFTIFTSLSSIILLFVVNVINYEEDKKENSILIALGFNDFQINKIQLFKNFSFTIPSMMSSIFTIIVISFMMKDVISSKLGLSVSYSIPFLSIFGIIILTFLITFLSFLFLFLTQRKRNLVLDLH